MTAPWSAAHTPDDFERLAELKRQRQQAAEAIARTTGASATRDQISTICNTAWSRVADEGTTVEYEIERAAERWAKAREARQRRRRTRASGQAQPDVHRGRGGHQIRDAEGQ